MTRLLSGKDSSSAYQHAMLAGAALPYLLGGFEPVLARYGSLS